MNKTQDVLRLTFAVIFVVGAAVNIYMLAAAPHIYRGFADAAFLPAYRELWAAHVFPNIQFFVGAVIVMELGFAFLLLTKAIGPRLGMGLAAAFMLFLVPFWWFGGSLVNLAFAIVFIWLLRFDYPNAIPDLFRHREGSPQA